MLVRLSRNSCRTCHLNPLKIFFEVKFTYQKINCFKANSSVAFNTFALLCKQHFCLVPTHLHHPKSKLHSHYGVTLKSSLVWPELGVRYVSERGPSHFNHCWHCFRSNAFPTTALKCKTHLRCKPSSASLEKSPQSHTWVDLLPTLNSSFDTSYNNARLCSSIGLC